MGTQDPAPDGDPTVVAPDTTHPSFNKAAYLLGLTVHHVSMRSDFRADIAAMETAITPDTMMLVGSAPLIPVVGEESGTASFSCVIGALTIAVNGDGILSAQGTDRVQPPTPSPVPLALACPGVIPNLRLNAIEKFDTWL